MDVALISADVLRVKTKSVPFTIHTKNALSISFDNSPVLLTGPGEYEMKGLKITGLGKMDILGFAGKIDGLALCITKASFLKQAKDQFGDYAVLIVEEDEVLDEAVFAVCNANVVILYGEKAKDQAKALGKDVVPVNKYSITKEKLPAELEIIVLQ